MKVKVVQVFGTEHEARERVSVLAQRRPDILFDVIYRPADGHSNNMRYAYPWVVIEVDA